MLGSVALAGPTDAEAEAAAHRILSDPDYQTELPTDAPVAERTGTHTNPRERSHTTDSSDSSDSGDSDPGRSLARFLWYLLIAVVIGGLLLWAVREVLDPKVRNVRAPAAAVTTPRPSTPAAPAVPEHVSLAAAGQHAEAVHALLLATLRDIHRRAGSLAPAWTSREILYRVALPPDARAALEEIVRAVEWSRFGGAAVGPAEYEACVRQAEACRAALPEKAA